MSVRRLWIVFIYSLLTLPSSAQGFNYNVGGGPGFPLSKTSDFAKTSYHFVAGAGPNLHSHVKLNAEFMFHGLPVQPSIIKQLGLSDAKGRSNAKGRLYSLTGNLMLGSELGLDKSAYLIGGGGWYWRTVEAKHTVLQAGAKCEQGWLWWDIQCVNGVFPTNVTVGSRTLSAGGFNVGGGLTFRLGDSGANLYTEVRYHRAFTRNIETSVLPLTIGVRW